MGYHQRWRWRQRCGKAGTALTWGQPSKKSCPKAGHVRVSGAVQFLMDHVRDHLHQEVVVTHPAVHPTQRAVWLITRPQTMNVDHYTLQHRPTNNRPLYSFSTGPQTMNVDHYYNECRPLYTGPLTIDHYYSYNIFTDTNTVFFTCFQWLGGSISKYICIIPWVDLFLCIYVLYLM